MHVAVQFDAKSV